MRRSDPSAMGEDLPSSGYLLLAILTVTWGLGWPMMKTALGEFPPWTFRTICVILGGVGALGLARASGAGLAVPAGQWKPLLLVSLVNVTGWNIFSAYGLLLIEAGRSAIIAYTMPVWACILAKFVLGERMTTGRWAALLLGASGLAVLIGPDLRALGKEPLGALFMLGAAMSWAWGSVLIKSFEWKMPASLFVGWQLILGGAPIVAGSLVLEAKSFSSLEISWGGGLAMVYVVLVGVIFGYWGWIRLIELFPVSLASIGTLAVPVIGVLSSAFLLGEAVGLREMVALALVVAALGMVSGRPGEKKKEEGG
jgi:drug/metabolite transporter (DMT)-like permease